MKNCPRVFYFCSINTQGYERKLNQRLHVGAATNKVLSVVAALRRAGCRAYPVSLPVLGRLSKTRSVHAQLIRDQNSLVIFLRTVAHPLLRRLLGMIEFAGFCWKVDRRDRVLLYNFMPEYLLVLLILRLKGNPAILDAEDAPRNDVVSWREFANQATYKATRLLCRRRYLTVSLQVANDFNLQPACVVYGATKPFTDLKSKSSPDEKCFRILYGGTLCNDTGLQLFCDAITRIQKHNFSGDKMLVFIVTGFGGEEQIQQLTLQCSNDHLRIEKKTDLSADDYQNELLSCHAALCLKLPDSEMGATTFPSKIVEITSAGLLLISTKVSDIPQLFDNQNALLLDDATPEQLGSAIVWAMENPEACKARAIRGQERARQLFSEVAVGQRIRDFLFP